MRKIFAWIITIVGAIGFPYGVYVLFTNGDERYFPMGTITTIFSAVLFSTGAIILDLKGSKIYKTILGTVIVLLVLLFIAGELQII